MNRSEQTKLILQDAIVIDGQLGFEVDMPWEFSKKWDLIDRYAKAGFTALTLSLANEETSTEKALEYLAKVRQHIFAHPNKYILAKNKDDILRAKNEHKIALRLMFQGTGPLGRKLELLEIFHELGITSVLLAYNIRTAIGDGVIETHDGGLSHLGKRFVSEMNCMGITIDCSHAGFRTSMEALTLTTAPVIFSHSGIYGVTPHVRNIYDEQIIAVAKSQGVVGISGLGVLIGDPNASVEKYVDHIDYVKKLVGTEYIAIGLDNLYFADDFAKFMQNQSITHPQAYASKVNAATTWKCLQPEDMSLVVEVLLRRGYTEKEIKGILGGNILRIMK